MPPAGKAVTNAMCHNHMYIDAWSSLRAQYGTDARMNAVHGSDSQDSAAR